jgi:hypothetical protein
MILEIGAEHKDVWRYLCVTNNIEGIIFAIAIAKINDNDYFEQTQYWVTSTTINQRNVVRKGGQRIRNTERMSGEEQGQQTLATPGGK